MWSHDRVSGEGKVQQLVASGLSGKCSYSGCLTLRDSGSIGRPIWRLIGECLEHLTHARSLRHLETKIYSCVLNLHRSPSPRERVQTFLLQASKEEVLRAQSTYFEAYSAQNIYSLIASTRRVLTVPDGALP